MGNSMLVVTASFIGILQCATVSAQVTQRVSVNSSGGQGNGASGYFVQPSISADGRCVAFASEATNLVPGDTNAATDVFVRDRQTGATERVSVDSGGAQSGGGNYSVSISADGRYVAFDSTATDLVPGDTNGFLYDVFVRDRQLGTTELVSVDTSGVQGNNASLLPSISADGRYVAFWSAATNLVPGDTNGSEDIFVRDRQLGTTERVSVDSGGVQGDSDSGRYGLSISGDGRFVAFCSWANNLVPGDTGFGDVFVRDLQGGTTERVSVDSGGAQGDGDSSNYGCSISFDGRYVTFCSDATNLVLGDTNGSSDVFIRDRQLGTTDRVSIDSSGAQANSLCEFPAISADGRYVAFDSYATNLVPGDTNGFYDDFVRDRQLGTTERTSVDSSGTEANHHMGPADPLPSISADGRYVAYADNSTNLVPGDTNGFYDVFVRDRTGGTSFTSLCDPGLAGVQACPCSNAPSGAGRGCNNSASTGGAILTASGGTFLSSDSLVFTTSGEKPTATSIVLQGTSSPPAGIIYGQGIRCVGGSLKRLFVKSAVAGSITAPNFGAGDPTVSARSAAKGDVIGGGQSRWYLVFYRDPTVLGGCPATSTFNATQTGRVDWLP